MSEVALTWDEFELLVLHWVFNHTGEDSGLITHGSTKPLDGIPGLTEAQFVEAVERLIEFGLVAARSGPVTTVAFTIDGARRFATAPEECLSAGHARVLGTARRATPLQALT